jgi:hypothetical protein
VFTFLVTMYLHARWPTSLYRPIHREPISPWKLWRFLMKDDSLSP